MAVLPTRLLEIEFDAGVWTDVFADVVDITTRRGRNRELGAFETGSGFVTLRNETRKYDPEYAAGAYYGKLRPNRRIRFRATYSAVTYPVMVGYIDRISQSYDGPNGAVTVIAFSDLFKILNRVELPTSVYAAEVLDDSPSTWFRLGDPVGDVARDSIQGITGTRQGAGAFGAASLVVREPDGAYQQTSNADGIVITDPRASITTAAWTVEFLVQGADTGLSSNVWSQYALTPAGLVSISILAFSDQTAGISIVSPTVTGSTPSSTAKIFNGAVHHVMANYDGTNLRFHIDGVLEGTSGALVGFTPVAGSITIGGPPIITTSSMIGVIDEVATYPTALFFTDAVLHNQAARTPWRGDTPGDRADAILSLAGVSLADRQLDTGTTTLQNTSLGGSALAYLQKIADTELAEVFVTRDGKVRLLGRREALTGAYLTSVATLADATPAAGEVGYRDVSFEVDDADIITRATVSRDGSVAVTYQDTAARAEFGLVDFTADGLLHDDDAYSSDYAQWIVNTHKTPNSRAGAVLITLPADPANTYPKILGLEIGDRVTLKRRPKVGAAISRDMRVEAVAHSTGGSRWATTLQLSPFDIAGPGLPVWIWGTTKWGQQVWGL